MSELKEPRSIEDRYKQVCANLAAILVQVGLPEEEAQRRALATIPDLASSNPLADAQARIVELTVSTTNLGDSLRAYQTES